MGAQYFPTGASDLFRFDFKSWSVRPRGEGLTMPVAVDPGPALLYMLLSL